MESKLKVLFVEKLSRNTLVEDSTAIAQAASLEAQFGEAVRRREFKVHFQPQYEVNGGRGCGVEALARWTTQNGEEISPTVFIPLAERTALIRPLGAWVLEQACATVAGWGDLGGHAPTLSVNASSASRVCPATGWNSRLPRVL